VPLYSNQVKSLQAGIHADGGRLYLVRTRTRRQAFRVTGRGGQPAQMEFAKVGERDRTRGGVLTLILAVQRRAGKRLWPGLRDATHRAQ